MNLDSVRVKVNKKYHPLYKAVTQDTVTRHRLFEQHSDLFTFCMVLGFREGRSNPVKSETLFWSNAFNGYQQTTIIAIAMSSKGDYDLLTQPDAVVQIAEGYAEVGMELLLAEVFNDYRREEQDGSYTLNFADAHQLEKTILGYIQREINENPFS